jgi:hypothetical protein
MSTSSDHKMDFDNIVYQPEQHCLSSLAPTRVIAINTCQTLNSVKHKSCNKIKGKQSEKNVQRSLQFP